MLLTVLALLLMPIGIMAEDTTDGANWNTNMGVLFNPTIGHDHDYTKYEPQFEAGVGLDLTIYENEGQGLAPNEVTIESKYDFGNENGSVYLVAKYNVWDMFFSGN